MKEPIMTLAALALVVSGPAFAGCGSHGGGTSRAYSAPSYSAPASRATLERKAAAAKKAKRMTAKAVQEAEDALAEADAADAKLPKQAVAAVEAIAGTDTLAPIADEAARQCKQYSATIGSLISVACE